MYADILMIYLVLDILLLLFSIILVEENPQMSIITIIAGLMFSVYCAFGFSSIDYVQYDLIISDTSYFDSYGIGCLLLFILFVLLFIKAGFNYVRDKTEEAEQRDRRNMR